MKVEYIPGIASMSGSLKMPGGKRLIFRHYASDRPGHGHATVCSANTYKRRTPVTEAEQAAKRLFSRRASYVKQLCDAHPGLSRAEAWQQAKAYITSPDRPPETIFLHGKPFYKALNDHTPLVQVDIPDRPEGRYPVCTLANAERYGLTIYKNF